MPYHLEQSKREGFGFLLQPNAIVMLVIWLSKLKRHVSEKMMESQDFGADADTGSDDSEGPGFYAKKIRYWNRYMWCSAKFWLSNLIAVHKKRWYVKLPPKDHSFSQQRCQNRVSKGP